ncbi:hypothetical protein EMIT0324P_11630 [Pseudomonas chlororaphis]
MKTGHLGRFLLSALVSDLSDAAYNARPNCAHSDWYLWITRVLAKYCWWKMTRSSPG